MNMARLWCKIMFKTNVEQTKRNGESYFWLYPFGEFSLRKFPRRLLCVHQVKKFLENLPN
jgi:hypothetical protein